VSRLLPRSSLPADLPHSGHQGRRCHHARAWNEFAGNPAKVDEGTRQHYAKLYARPGAMHAAFAQFRSIRQDALDNAPVLQKHLSMPVLAVGG
jgi:hypothetical protein